MTDYLLIDRTIGIPDGRLPGWYYQRSDNSKARWFGPFASGEKAKAAAEKATNSGKCINEQWVNGRLGRKP